MENSRIGDIGKFVQVDERATCWGKLILDQFNSLEKITGGTCIVGGVIEGQLSDIFLVIFPNRKWE